MLFIVILTSSFSVNDIFFYTCVTLLLHNLHKSSKEFEMTSNLVFLPMICFIKFLFFTSDILTRYFFNRSFFFSLTQLLEDVQRVLSVKIDEESTETLEIISEDFKTLRKIWNKVRQRPAQETLSGKIGISWIF